MQKIKIDYFRLKKFIEKKKKYKFFIKKKNYHLPPISLDKFNGYGITFANNFLITIPKFDNKREYIIIGNLNDTKIPKKTNCILVDDPKITFIKILNMFSKKVKNQIHPTAIIHPKAKIGKNVSVGAYSVIDECNIGEDTIIGSLCKIGKKTSIKKRVRIGDLCCIGEEGISSTRDKNKFLHFKHYSSTIIEDDVWIGTNTNINRGVLTPTKIMKNSNIGSKCEIGHNVIIKQLCSILSGSIISGSAVIGKESFIGCSVFINNGIKIANYSTIGAGATLMKNISKTRQLVLSPVSKVIKNYII